MLRRAFMREPKTIACSRWLEHWMSHLPAARAGAQPEGLHQVRVALGRLRVWLRLGGERALEEELQRLRARCGAARDLDVLLAMEPPAVLVAELRRRRAREQEKVAIELGRARAMALARKLAALAPLEEKTARRALRGLARRAARARRGGAAQGRSAGAPCAPARGAAAALRAGVAGRGRGRAGEAAGRAGRDRRRDDRAGGLVVAAGCARAPRVAQADRAAHREGAAARPELLGRGEARGRAAGVKRPVLEGESFSVTNPRARPLVSLNAP